jgi:hypothetical protein
MTNIGHISDMHSNDVTFARFWKSSGAIPDLNRRARSGGLFAAAVSSPTAQ